ncbi:MAG: hypothetical protein JSU91_05660, partial [Thermoplasmatales archaeon]
MSRNSLITNGIVAIVVVLLTCASFMPSINGNIEFKKTSMIFLEVPPEEEWNRTFGGIDYDDGYSVQQTNDGGYIITGFTNSFGAGNWDALLIKTDPDGIEEWNHTFGGVSYDRGYSVQQTNDGGYIITGCTQSFGASSFDVWLIKTDPDGIEEWNHTFGGSNEDWGYSVQQTNDSGYIIAGYTHSYGAGESDFWLIKTDTNGIEEWNHTFGGNYADRGRSVQQTDDDGYIIAGNTVSYDSDDTGCDVWLIKTDSNGIIEWHQTFGGSGTKNKFDIGYSVQQTDEGGYIIAGDTEIYQVDMADFLLIKTDSDGKQEWYKTFGGSYADRGRSVQQTKDGGYILTGWTFSYSIIDPDIWLIKTDSGGTENWNLIFMFGENSGDWGYSVEQTNDNGYIITGATMPEGWMSVGSSSSNTVEGTNVWLIKVEGENLPPDAPKIDGQQRGKSGIEYNYTFVTTDLDGDEVYYYIDWDDSNIEEWIGPYASGLEVKVNHTWEEIGTYIIKAKAKDIFDSESDWASFDIEIPRNRATT